MKREINRNLNESMNIQNNLAIVISTLFISISVIFLNLYVFYFKKTNLDINDYMLVIGLELLIPYILATVNSILKGYIDMSIKVAFKISIGIITALAITQFALVFSQVNKIIELSNIMILLLLIGFTIFAYLIYYLIQNLATKHMVIFQVIFIAIFLVTGIFLFI